MRKPSRAAKEMGRDLRKLIALQVGQIVEDQRRLARLPVPEIAPARGRVVREPHEPALVCRVAARDVDLAPGLHLSEAPELRAERLVECLPSARIGQVGHRLGTTGPRVPKHAVHVEVGAPRDDALFAISGCAASTRPVVSAPRSVRSSNARPSSLNASTASSWLGSASSHTRQDPEGSSRTSTSVPPAPLTRPAALTLRRHRRRTRCPGRRPGSSCRARAPPWRDRDGRRPPPSPHGSSP